MKYLEHVRLVQFYLFEKEDLHLSEITGIFGSNGSGKSSVLDAVQIAVMGANKNFIALNAQADEQKKTQRSLRAYCLGQYGELPEHRARENATTYITLVWRDTETNEPTSMGVCLYAAADREGDEVLGRYILRGVELTMSDHLEVVNDEERPRSWATFRHQLVERAKATTGENPIYLDSERYIRAALLALRGSDRTPELGAFTRAFRFGLRMRFDKSVDQIVRDNVLEPRPTDIKKFKEITDSFRHLKELVEQVEAKIKDGQRVETEYAKAFDESRRAVTLDALLKAAKVEIARGSLDTAVQARNNAEEALKAKNAENEALSTGIREAKSQAQRYREQREAHSSHKDYGALQTAISSANAKAKEKKLEIERNLSLVALTLGDAVKFTGLADHSEHLRTAATRVFSLKDKVENLTKDAIEAGLRPALTIAEKASNVLFSQGTEIQRQLSEAKRALADAQSNLQRIKEGRAPLDRSVQQLLSELNDAGLHPRPVCDLVRITDPEWQPVIESYLGRNVQALLVPRVEEASAFRIYRSLSGPRALYGPKIARESRLHLDRSAVPGSVAELIEGDHPAAVAYLRAQLWDIKRATTDEEALDGKRTLTKDGMLMSSRDFERLRPVPASSLRIGAGGSSHREAIQQEINDRTKEVTRLEGVYAALKELLDSMQRVANKDLVMKFILMTWDEMNSARSEALDKTKLMKGAADEEYVKLGEAEKEWEHKAAELDSDQKELLIVIGNTQSTLDRYRADEQSQKVQLDETLAAAEAARQNPEYDSELGNKQWDSFVEKNGLNYVDMVRSFDDQLTTARRRMERAIREGRGELGSFLERYREQAPAEISDDWLKARDWIRDLLKRLNDTELVPYKEEMDQAYKTSQDTFRNDVATALNDNLYWLEETLRRLNDVLAKCPTFSNGERYHFRREIRPKFATLLKFVKDVAASGPEEDLFGKTSGEIPEEFRQLLEDKVTSGTAGMPSPLDDYREFFEFDIEILREDPVSKASKVVGHLSKRIGPGSGGEHRAPLYIIAGAALASAYHLDRGNNDGPRLMLLDEAFNKMDPTNIIATMQYLEQLNLQVFMASPGEHLGTLTAFLHRYYEIQRDVDNSTVMTERYDVTPAARALYREDLYEFNPALIEQELVALRQAAAPRNLQREP